MMYGDNGDNDNKSMEYPIELVNNDNEIIEIVESPIEVVESPINCNEIIKIVESPIEIVESSINDKEIIEVVESLTYENKIMEVVESPDEVVQSLIHDNEIKGHLIKLVEGLIELVNNDNEIIKIGQSVKFHSTNYHQYHDWLHFASLCNISNCILENLYEAKRFPLFSFGSFDYDEKKYDISRVFSKDDLVFNQEGYNGYSKMHFSLSLTTVTASLAHFVLHHGRDTWQQFKAAWEDRNEFEDVHSWLMESYKPIPQWWFLAIVVSMVGLSVLTLLHYVEQLQLPYWGCY